tara:strand:+ start:744 stop:1700 length:957 start_codon:yes stop_codon:yes gene_type:complete
MLILKIFLSLTKLNLTKNKKIMRKVLKNNSEAIHYFANEVQESGQNQTRSIFFNGNKLYSYGYHYLLGLRLNNGTLIINDDGYSVSTGRHISILRSAATHKKVFCLSEIHLDNMFKNIVINNQKMKKAWKHKIFYARSIVRNFEKYEEFLSYCKKNRTTIKEISREFPGVIADKRSSYYKDMKSIYLSVKEDLPLLEKTDAAEAAIRLKKLAEKNKKNQIKWRADSNFTFYGGMFNEPALLRICKASKYIESTKGVKLPIDVCKHFLNLLFSGENLVNSRLDNYVVNFYDGKTLKINCHTFLQKELENILVLINNLKK